MIDSQYYLILGNYVPSFESGVDKNDTLGLILEQNEDNLWELIVTNKIDYEALKEKDPMTFDVFVGSDAITVSLRINNIDDNPPYIEVITNPCQIDVSILAIRCFI